MRRLSLHHLILSCILCVAVLVQLIPFIFFGSHPLGYDTGFYRRYLLNSHQVFESFPGAPVPGLDHTIIAPRIFLDVLNVLPLNPDLLLYGSYIVLVALTIFLFYYLISLYTSQTIALIGAALLTFSSVFYLGYWFMLYKNFFALIFFFLTFIAFKKEWRWLALISAAIIPLSHQTTTIVFLATFSLYLMLKLIVQRKVAISDMGILVITVALYLYLHPRVGHKIASPPVGIFLERMQFLLAVAPLLLFAIPGIPRLWNVLRNNLLVLSFTVVVVAFPLFSLPYYQRILLYLNFVVILAAAVGLYEIWWGRFRHHRYRIWLVILTIVLLGAHGYFFSRQVQARQPLINESIVEELSQLHQVPADSSVVTSPRLTPWAQGWSQAKVYAPGLLRDKRTSQEWYEYWGTPSIQAKIDFLSAFPQPLYIFVDPADAPIYVPRASCVEQLSAMLFGVKCTTIQSNELPA
jgi:hypothetical protein